MWDNVSKMKFRVGDVVFFRFRDKLGSADIITRCFCSKTDGNVYNLSKYGAAYEAEIVSYDEGLALILSGIPVEKK